MAAVTATRDMRATALQRKRGRGAMVAQLLRESVRQSRQPSDRHSHRQILSFNKAGRCGAHVGAADDRRLPDGGHLWNGRDNFRALSEGVPAGFLRPGNGYHP